MPSIPLKHPKFGYALLAVHPSQGYFKNLDVVNDPKQADGVDNTGFYLLGFDDDLDALSKGMGIPKDQFRHHPSGNSDIYTFKVESPELTQSVMRLNEVVEAGQAPSATLVQDTLSKARKALNLDWIHQAFDFSRWNQHTDIANRNPGKKRWYVYDSKFPGKG